MVTEIQWIVVGAVTRRRPLMFADLLMSFETLRLPENTKLSFCFVENDDTLSITEKVSQFGCKSGFDVQAILETQPVFFISRILPGEKVVVQTNFCSNRMCGGNPVQRTFYFSAVLGPPPLVSGS